MSENEKIVGQLMRWKIKARDLEQKLADKDAEIAKRDARIQEIETQYDELETEINQYMDEQEAQNDPAKVDSELQALRTQLVRTQLESKFDKLTNGQLNDGVNFDHVLRNIPDLDISKLDANLLDDEFYTNFAQEAREKAPYLFRPSQEATSTPTERASQDMPAAKRNLPTFLSRSSGGGTPPPVETSIPATRLRDPAEAQKRAAEARAEAV